jgi:hypothetical protein
MELVHGNVGVVKRAELLVGLAALVIGVALALRPFHQSVDLHAQGLTPPLIGVSDCGVPVAASFSGDPDGGWFAYAPGTEVTFSGRFMCRYEARWRAGGGLVVAVTGLGLVLFAAKPRARPGGAPRSGHLVDT